MTGWGFTNRPYPTMTGHIIATRQASGAQNVFRAAIEAGEFTPAPLGQIWRKRN